MKLLILENFVTDQQTLDAGVSQFKAQLDTIGFPIEITRQKTDKQFTSLPFSNSVNSNGYFVNPSEIQTSGYDATLLVYDWNRITPKPTNPADNGNIMQIPCQWYTTYPEVFSAYALHELCHLMFSRSGQQDITHLPVDGTLQTQYPDLYTKYCATATSLIPYYLYLLTTQKSFWGATIPTVYKYFQQSEIVGLKPELVQKLDIARGYAGIPFVITSGFRTVKQNTDVGGVANSSHLTGEAADIKCVNAVSRWKIVNAMIKAGFNRIEVAKGHVHCDVSKTLPQNILDVSLNP